MSRLSFSMTMDQHARDVDRENPAKDGVVDGSTTRIGSIQWHRGREARFVTLNLESFTLSELRNIVQQLEGQVLYGGAKR
jgi:hypothetical protein